MRRCREGSTFPLKTMLLAISASGLVLLGGCRETTEDSPPETAAAGGQFSGLPEVCTAPADFPADGFDYPQAAATVEQWVADRDEARARVHGWNLWAGLNTAASGDQPVWRTWCTATQAFAQAGGGGRVGSEPGNETAGNESAGNRTTGNAAAGNESAGNEAAAQSARTRLAAHRQRTMQAIRRSHGLTASSEDPIDFSDAPLYPIPEDIQRDYAQCYLQPSEQLPVGGLADGEIFQSNGDVMIAGVIYNQPAYNWIRDRLLFEGATLDALMPTSGGTAQMPAMPTGSIVLKPMMWPIQGNGYTALPMWDNATDDNGTYAGFEVQSMWPRGVAVTANPTSEIATTDVTWMHGVQDSEGLPLAQITYRNAPVVPVQRFYTFRFPDLDALSPCDRAILDASAYWAYGRRFAADDYLALVAMHVMTKEQPAWTFQSVWWHDRPNDGPFAANRPAIPGATGPWQQYLMTSTYGIPAEPGGASWPVAYNPYIELAADHPIRTNCMNCHRRAAWPRKPRTPHGNYEAPGGPDSLAILDWTNAIFDGLLTTDNMWGIPDRAAEPSGGRVGAAPSAPAGGSGR